ncbi:MAG TPA: heme ABC exporter ATP-binding protein CcmA [Afifellaceae bacterium]|nr:heme ABC exporter ATP-binding protein CcmA [Afifellaceae bacterium]
MTERVNKFSSLRLQAEALCCERGGREVFRDIAFSAGSGQLLAVTGPNGAGKSSLLRIVAGLLSPSAGRVSVETGDHDADPAASVHYLGHLDGLKSAMSLRENLAFWNRIYCGTGDPGAIAAAAGRLGLAHALDLPVGVFSAGQRRRAVLARITLSPRPLWLLDEPTSALDKDGEAALGDLMREHLVTGGVIVAATHLDLPVWPDLSLRMAVPE